MRKVSSAYMKAFSKMIEEDTKKLKPLLNNLKIEKTNASSTQMFRSIYTELEQMGYSKKSILELFELMETLPVHKVTDEAKRVEVVLAKAHIVVI